MFGRDDVMVLVAECHGAARSYGSAARRPHLWSGRDIVGLDELYVRPHVRDAGIGNLLMVAPARLVAADQLVISAAQRFCARLGATLRMSPSPAGGPERYGAHLG